MSFWRRRRDHPWGDQAVVPPASNKLLEEDDVSYILLEDGSFILLE